MSNSLKWLLKSPLSCPTQSHVVKSPWSNFPTTSSKNPPIHTHILCQVLLPLRPFSPGMIWIPLHATCIKTTPPGIFFLFPIFLLLLGNSLLRATSDYFIILVSARVFFLLLLMTFLAQISSSIHYHSGRHSMSQITWFYVPHATYYLKVPNFLSMSLCVSFPTGI